MTNADYTQTGPVEDQTLVTKRLDVESEAPATFALGRADFAELKLAYREVPVPEIRAGAVAIVQELFAGERDEYEGSLIFNQASKGDTQPLDLKDARARLIVKTLVDRPGGSRLFSDSAVDIAIVSRWPAHVADRLYTVAKELSGITQKDEAELLGKLKRSQQTNASANGSG